MKSFKPRVIILCTMLIVTGLCGAVFGQTESKRLAVAGASASSVRWDVAVTSYSNLTLTVSAPDGRVFRKEFKVGALPEFGVIDKNGARLPDGTYTYEMRFQPTSLGAASGALKTRPPDDEPEADRAARRREAPPELVQSGTFSIMNGVIVVAGAVESPRSISKAVDQQPLRRTISANTVNRLRNHRLSLRAMPDVVTADDEIIQGSLCVGLDCVNNESFGFDTIRLKENNTRISFNDTSTGSFPTNDWTIRANSNASGGANFLAFVDRGANSPADESGTIVFEVDAGAPANALKVDSTGRIGLRTATPALDIHTNTSNTPAMRLEQNNSGGFVAQTWDIAGNEANFFVRDVTGGSRLPFRIRPGAPTSSIDIGASGNVGIGTASPAQKLQVAGAGVQRFSILETGNSVETWVVSNTTNGFVGTVSNHFLNIGTNALARITVLANGRVGVGTTAPDQVFSVNGDASKVGGGSWQSFSDERLKNIKGNFARGLSAVMRLQPLRYEYKPNNVLGLKSEGEHVGFGAQALQKVIPEAVTKNAEGYLMVNNDPVIWTMLNAIKEQQQEIAGLKAEVRKLRAASRRHRK